MGKHMDHINNDSRESHQVQLRKTKRMANIAKGRVDSKLQDSPEDYTFVKSEPLTSDQKCNISHIFELFLYYFTTIEKPPQFSFDSLAKVYSSLKHSLDSVSKYLDPNFDPEYHIQLLETWTVHDMACMYICENDYYEIIYWILVMNGKESTRVLLYRIFSRVCFYNPNVTDCAIKMYNFYHKHNLLGLVAKNLHSVTSDINELINTLVCLANIISEISIPHFEKYDLESKLSLSIINLMDRLCPPNTDNSKALGAYMYSLQAIFSKWDFTRINAECKLQDKLQLKDCHGITEYASLFSQAHLSLESIDMDSSLSIELKSYVTRVLFLMLRSNLGFIHFHTFLSKMEYMMNKLANCYTRLHLDPEYLSICSDTMQIVKLYLMDDKIGKYLSERWGSHVIKHAVGTLQALKAVQNAYNYLAVKDLNADISLVLCNIVVDSSQLCSELYNFNVKHGNGFMFLRDDFLEHWLKQNNSVDIKSNAIALLTNLLESGSADVKSKVVGRYFEKEPATIILESNNPRLISDAVLFYDFAVRFIQTLNINNACYKDYNTYFQESRIYETLQMHSLNSTILEPKINNFFKLISTQVDKTDLFQDL